MLLMPAASEPYLHFKKVIQSLFIGCTLIKDKMITNRALVALSLVALTSACTTTEKRDWIGVGGSKADGTVILGIDLPAKFGVVEPSATWDVQQANQEAERRCKNWNFAGAELFGDKLPVQVVCSQMPGGISPCGQKTYRVLFQCMDYRK